MKREGVSPPPVTPSPLPHTSMRAREAFRAAVDSIASHKMRSGLTMLGMMFGVGAVIAMLSIGAGAELQALSLIERMGVRNVVVRGLEMKQEQLREVRKKSVGVSLRDVEAIRDVIAGAETVLPRVRVGTLGISSATGNSDAAVFGVTTAQPDVSSLRVEQGRFFTAREQSEHAQVAILGAAARRSLFGAYEAIGQVFKINDVWFEVIGVLAESGLSSGSADDSSFSSSGNEIHIPVTTALRKFEKEALRAPLKDIVVQMAVTASPSATAEAIDRLLQRLHGGAKDYEIIVPEALLQQSRRTQELFNIVMGCIASISLLVGGIGIMNIMLASVLELTREIGIRRAVGARRRDIRLQFLLTSFAISVLGGFAGIVVGVVISKLVAAYADWPTVVTTSSIVLSTGVSVLVGLLSGLFPAIRAANLNPIDALRYE